MYGSKNSDLARQQEMRDPFKPNSNKQLIREAQFGFTVIGLLVAVLIYVAWFRLNGLHDRTPAHIRDAPIAVQVFPNSPNYDRESHEMIGGVSARGSASLPGKKKIADAPRRMMEDSQDTARHLSTSASAIDRTATRVASMIGQPKNKTSSIASTTAPSKGSSGFKPLPTPKTKSLPAPKKVSSGFISLPRPPAKTTTLKSGSASKANSGFKLLPPPKAKQSFAVPTIKSPTKPLPEVGTNDFKPLTAPSTNAASASSTKVFIPTKSQLQPKLKPVTKPKPDSATMEIPRPKKLPDESPAIFRPLRSRGTFSVPEPKTKPLKPKSPFSATAAPIKTPNVKTVSFESNRWLVKDGDSFWSIAQSNYGDGRFFRALYETNRRLVPGFEDLVPGVELQLPTKEQLIEKYARLCPADAVHANDEYRVTPDEMVNDMTSSCDTDIEQRLYETTSTDTLFTIARRELGQASRYVELIELNRFRIGDDVTHETVLRKGIKLLLPEK